MTQDLFHVVFVAQEREWRDELVRPVLIPGYKISLKLHSDDQKVPCPAGYTQFLVQPLALFYANLEVTGNVLRDNQLPLNGGARESKQLFLMNVLSQKRDNPASTPTNFQTAPPCCGSSCFGPIQRYSNLFSAAS